MRIKLKNNCITINDKSLFIVLNNDGDFDLEEKDNFTVTSSSDECIIDLDLSKHKDKISFIGFIKFTYDRITYTSYFFWVGKGLLKMITHLPSGVNVQCRDIGIDFQENESDFIIKYNEILTKKDRKLMPNIKYNPETWDEVLFNIVGGYQEDEFGPCLIKLDSKFYVLRTSVDITEIYIGSINSINQINTYIDKLEKNYFIELLFNNKNKIQCVSDTKFGYVYKPEQLPDDVKKLDLKFYIEFEKEYRRCLLVCVPNKSNHNTLEIPIANLNFGKLILNRDKSNKTRKLEL